MNGMDVHYHFYSEYTSFCPSEDVDTGNTIYLINIVNTANIKPCPNTRIYLYTLNYHLSQERSLDKFKIDQKRYFIKQINQVLSPANLFKIPGKFALLGWTKGS